MKDKGVLFVLACLIAFASYAVHNADEKQEAKLKAADNESGIERLYLQFALDKHAVVSGEEIRYRATLPREKKLEAASMSFHVERIGLFHRRLGRLVHLDDPLTTSTFPGMTFEDLDDTTGSHGLSLNITDDFRHGMVGKFRTIKAGYYLISTEWSFRDRKGSLKSNPVFLEVQPPKDAKGRPILNDKTCTGDDLEEQVRLEAMFDELQESWAK